MGARMKLDEIKSGLNLSCDGVLAQEQV